MPHQARRLQGAILEMAQWEELERAFNSIAELMLTALGQGQQEFETFLQRLDERLVHIQQHFQAQQDVAGMTSAMASDVLDR